MGGSVKGEKRGAAGRVVGAAKGKGAPKAPRAPQQKIGGPEKPHRTHTKASEEYYRDIHRVLNGETGREMQPRELMLEAMRYFHAQAEEHKQMAEWLLDQLKECKAKEDFEQWDVRNDFIGGRIREFYLIAVDIAYKAAPYVHARLSAVQVTGANNGPIEVVGMLLKEIDEANRGRPTWAPPQLELVASNG